VWGGGGQQEGVGADSEHFACPGDEDDKENADNSRGDARKINTCGGYRFPEKYWVSVFSATETNGSPIFLLVRQTEVPS
jgi:hypothetical protein